MIYTFFDFVQLVTEHLTGALARRQQVPDQQVPVQPDSDSEVEIIDSDSEVEIIETPRSAAGTADTAAGTAKRARGASGANASGHRTDKRAPTANDVVVDVANDSD